VSLSEKEKMLAGQLYHSLAPELMHEREQTKQLTRAYNDSGDMEERQSMLQGLLGAIGKNSYIEPPFQCNFGKHIFLGDNVYLNYDCIILDNNHVQIGSHTMLGPAVQIYTAIHPLDAGTRNQLLETAEKIIIGENVWIGGGAIILPGVTVGQNAVIGAGSVVTKDVEAWTVVGGNPATVIRKLDK
jgi:maltose O-acetyltransferase